MRIVERVFPFEPGQAVAYSTERSPISGRPVPIARGVIIRVSGTSVETDERIEWRFTNKFVTVLPLAGGKPTRIGVTARDVVHAGWCAACELPAHQSPAGGLFCPRCEQPAAAEPPPDVWIMRNWPDMSHYGARRTAQALRAPHLTCSELWSVLNRIDSGRRRAMEERFNVNPWRFTELQRRHLEGLADREDADGYAAAVERFQWRDRAIDRLLALFGADPAARAARRARRRSHPRRHRRAPDLAARRAAAGRVTGQGASMSRAAGVMPAALYKLPCRIPRF
jgi:hypothetical protein